VRHISASTWKAGNVCRERKSVVDATARPSPAAAGQAEHLLTRCDERLRRALSFDCAAAPDLWNAH
jgi:hypothetical protein